MVSKQLTTTIASKNQEKSIRDDQSTVWTSAIGFWALTSATTLIVAAGYHYFGNCGGGGWNDENIDFHDDNNTRNSSPNNALETNKDGEKCASQEQKDELSSSSSSSSFELPQHIQRELYKEERRKASVRFLAMKKPLYENIEMYAPDGSTMLCTIGRKKADWYVRKDLAVWREDDDDDASHLAIRLLFEPKNHRSKKISKDDNDDATMRNYNCTHKRNICVSCGAEDRMSTTQSENSCTGDSSNNNTGLMRHYVVPYAYRRLFPKKFKTHLPHDVVLLCLDCHVDAEQAAKKLRSDVYEDRYRLDPKTKPAMVVDHTIKAIQSKARALWKHKAKLPPAKIQEYEATLRDYRSEPQDLSEDVLADLATNLQPEIKNPDYIPLANLVVDQLCQTDAEIRDFVVEWRQFFVDTLQPRYLPVGWSVDSPVCVDVPDDDEHGV